jgi:peptidyl-prolyl cis-trans isomerase C
MKLKSMSVTALSVALIALLQLPSHAAVKVKSTSPAVRVEAPSHVDMLARGPGGIYVTRADIEAELVRAPAETRAQILAKPASVRQIVSNLMVRRMLAQEAVRDGLEKDPLSIAAMQIAKDRVLSDLRLQKLDAQNAPDAKAIESYALSMYNANKSKFERPEQYRARHILIANSGAESKSKATELLNQLRAGADFEALAKANSTDSSSAAKGGDLGFFGPGRMVRPFEDAVLALKNIGDLSEVVESQFGFHIIRLEERKEKGVAPFDEVKGSLTKEAYTALMNDSRIQKVESLNKVINIDDAAIEAWVDPAHK